MKKPHNSIDGFVLRRRSGPVRPHALDDTSLPQKFRREHEEAGFTRPQNQSNHAQTSGLKRSEIDESLNSLEGDGPGPYRKKRRFLNKRFFKRLLKIIIILVILVGLFIGIKALIASSKIFSGNLFGLVAPSQPLKTDANGRSNIVIFGTSEDDSHEHDGASLTDSIMLLSVDQKKKTTTMTSVPRDLWVKYDEGCEFGYQGKINAVYECGAGTSSVDTHSDEGANALRSKVGDVYGLDVQYFVHVNYTALQQSVDAVGGVDIVIESDDPRGILDRNFDWECGYKCYYVKYANGPAHLDGKRALMLARARNDAGGYGLAGGNFDREKNQQKILVALRSKAASAGTLANPVATTQLIDSLGDNVRTNFVAGEVKTLMELAQKIKDDKIDRFSLGDEDPGLLTTGNVNGQSVVRPVAGLFDYSQIKTYVLKRLTADAATKEAATVMVLNGSGRPGAASEMGDKLTAQGFNVLEPGNAPVSTEYGVVSVYKVSTTKQPATSAKLAKNLKTKVKPGPLPYAMTSPADFVVIVGQ